MNKKLLLSFALAAAMTGCINDADVPSGNGDNPAPGARGGNMEISFVVPNSSNGSRAASDLFRAQVVINGGDAAEKVVFFLKYEIYVNHFIHFIHYLFRAYMQEMVLILQVSGSFLQ